MKARKAGTTADAAKGRPAGAKAAAVERRRVMSELRAFSHPLRLRIYELFAEWPRTTMQVAEVLGEPPTRLYHHVNALERAGLLRLRETRPIRGTVEKYFEAVRPGGATTTAEVLESDPAARQAARAAANAVLEQARHDLLASLPDVRVHGEAGPILLRMVVGTTPAKAARMRARVLGFLKRLKAECGEELAEGGDAAGRDAPGRETPERKAKGRWALTVAFAPSSRPARRDRRD